ncbi:MAG TPA: hypothetical protein DHW20_09320, partial [Gemmatimonadetes bacterium]|nr:hypothetical protein [Gemmatimonadota bacterium]
MQKNPRTKRSNEQEHQLTAAVSYDLLSRIAIVLDHPKNVVNIAGVTRVMQNFGLKTLRLVNPEEF